MPAFRAVYNLETVNLERALTQLDSVFAGNVEVVVTGVGPAAEGVEDEAVGTEERRGDAVVTLVVHVALLGILEGAVRLGTSERALGCEMRGKIKRFY